MAEKERKKRRKKPEEQERDEIVSTLIEESREALEELRSYFPHTADKLERFISPKRPPYSMESLFYFHLTEREREFRLNSLRAIIERFQSNGQVSKDEATKALEDAAALRDYAGDFKDSLLTIVQKALKLPLDAREKQTISLIRGKAEHHSYDLVRGVTLSLSWDGKLIKIAVDPKELARRRKALFFIGCSSDIQSDVARNHDAYFGGSLHE